MKNKVVACMLAAAMTMNLSGAMSIVHAQSSEEGSAVETEEEMDVDAMFQEAMSINLSGDHEAAMAIFQKLYDMGVGKGAEMIASMYERGEGVEQDYEKALEWNEKAGEMGSGRGYTNIGQMYENGNGVEQDYEKALEYYLKSMQTDDPDFKGARFAGLFYENGTGVDADIAKAAEYYQIAAESGDITGAYLLGSMYEEGRGVEQSYEEAAKYYEMAAAQSDNQQSADAAYALGKLYLDGNGVEADKEKGVEYLQQAAGFAKREAIADLEEMGIEPVEAKMPGGMGGPGGPGGGPNGGMMMGPGKETDEKLQELISTYVDQFEQDEFVDEDRNVTIPYNVFLPADYDETSVYPLVMFIADSSTVGTDLSRPLTQGYGALVWVTDEWQAENPCIVVVPQYDGVVVDDNNGYTTTEYLDATKDLFDHLTEKYAVDTDRIYGTGQSMGCMIHLNLAAKYPELYTACMFVDGQWKAEELAPLADQTFVMFAAGGDDKAYTGMQELIPVLSEAGAQYSEAEWNAKWSEEEIAAVADELFSEGNPINFIVWEKGSVIPDPAPEMAFEHMLSFDPAYKAEPARQWLFAQSK